MTEEEAMDRWCPMARVLPASTNNGGANRLEDADQVELVGSKCIASRCMMWRWNSQTTGYCGLAGRPAA